MGDNLAELLYMAWRSSLLSSVPDLPSWGNVRDPDVRAAWEAAATRARVEIKGQCATQLTSEYERQCDAEYAIRVCSKQWSS